MSMFGVYLYFYRVLCVSVIFVYKLTYPIKWYILFMRKER